LDCIGRFAPGLRLSGGDFPECRLLLLDPLADSADVGFTCASKAFHCDSNCAFASAQNYGAFLGRVDPNLFSSGK
jgi:hypothetical protein